MVYRDAMKKGTYAVPFFIVCGGYYFVSDVRTV